MQNDPILQFWHGNGKTKTMAFSLRLVSASCDSNFQIQRKFILFSCFLITGWVSFLCSMTWSHQSFPIEMPSFQFFRYRAKTTEWDRFAFLWVFLFFDATSITTFPFDSETQKFKKQCPTKRDILLNNHKSYYSNKTNLDSGSYKTLSERNHKITKSRNQDRADSREVFPKSRNHKIKKSRSIQFYTH